MANNFNLEEYKQERRRRKEFLEKTIAELREELETFNPAPPPKWTGRLNKKDRIDLERRLIGRIFYELKYGDVRERVAALGIGWRRFYDDRHKALWRSLETLDTRSEEERTDILKKEMLAEAREKDAGLKTGEYKTSDVDVDGVHILRGLPGSAADREYGKALVGGASDGIAWFGRELEAAGALPLVGGRAYLRELSEIGEGELLMPESMAEYLFGKKGDGNGKSNI